MIRCAQELDQTQRRVHVRSKRVAQIGIEVGQPRAVHHYIQGLCEAVVRRRV